MNTEKKFSKIFSESKSDILVSDGAMGTLLMQKENLEFDTPLEFNLRAPAEVRKVHRQYLNAGSQIINTNTFCANRLYLEKQDLAAEIDEINLRGAGLAEEARADYRAYENSGREVLITGSVGPTGSEEAIFLDDEDNRNLIRDTFSEQIELLDEGGADIITLETFYYHRELALAAEAAENADIPYFMNMSFTGPGPTEYGSTIEDFVRLIEEKPGQNFLAAGINCLTPSEDFRPLWKELAESTGFKIPVSLLFNAGEPELDTETGDMNYPLHESYFHEIEAFLNFMEGHRCIVGGCCGTEPSTIKKLVEMAD